MISYQESLQRIKAATSDFHLETQPCGLDDLLGRVLAETITSPANLPGFDNSAMDGFAVRANPKEELIDLEVHGNIAAGETPEAEVGSGAVQIMTGAPVPNGCETVIPIENVQVTADANGLPASIKVQGPILADQNIRRAGQDVRQGELVFSAGQKISAEHIMMLAALGISQAQVLTRPKISLISTGAELVDDPNAPLLAGQIRNSNQPFLATSLQSWPVETTQVTGHPDTKEQFLELLQHEISNGAQIVISTGAVSMGDRDFVPESLQEIGANIVFHKCKIRPGKPVLFAVLPDGGLFFGLPGNPVSAAVGFSFFVEPILRQILNQKEPETKMARLSKDFNKRAGFYLFAKARVFMKDSECQIEVLSGQQSFRIAPLAEANCWAELPEYLAEIKAGELVKFHKFAGVL
ncbi:MAG: molybdopterin molybdotransferase MoeA [Robiginitomaculum sp.]|nr:molybdopterin molybdotransferase MoeA [Robiginitomaculum sp.]